LVAAFLLHAGGALAAEHVDDAQAHARALLSGIPTSSSGAIAKSAAVSESGNERSGFDAQMQARRLILGSPGVNGAPEQAAASQGRAASPSGLLRQQSGHAAADAQEMARSLLQGRASQAGVSAHPLRARPGTPHPVAQRN